MIGVEYSLVETLVFLALIVVPSAVTLAATLFFTLWFPSEIWQPLRFWRIFGFWPKKEEPTHQVDQAIVDKRLGELAEDFLTACQTQQALKKAFLDKNIAPPSQLVQLEWKELRERRKELENLRRNLEKATGEVKRTKPRFWEARKLAGQFPYFVRPKAKDYVSLPEAFAQVVEA